MLSQRIEDRVRSRHGHWAVPALDARPMQLEDEPDNGSRRQAAKRSSADIAARREVPFFIIGSPRSGTSLLSRMLNAHSRLGVPYETKIVQVFHNMAAIYEPLDEVENRRRLVIDILDFPTMRRVQPQVTVEQAMAAIDGDTIAEVMDGILDAWVVQQGKSRWGEKTPSNVFHLALPAEWFPQAQFLHIIRDGRDVASSLVAAPFGPKTPYTAAKRWERFVRAGQEFGASLPTNRYLELRYEDLLDRPESEMRRICGFLDERFDTAMLRYHEQSTRYPSDPVNARNLNRPMIKENSHRWVQTMAPRDLEIVEAAVAPTLRQLAYDPVTRGRQIKGMEELYRTHLEPLPRRAVSMARNRAGQIQGLARLRLKAKLWHAALLGK